MAPEYIEYPDTAPNQRYRRYRGRKRKHQKMISIETYQSSDPAMGSPTQDEQALILAPGPSYTASITWKSPAVLQQEEWERCKQRVRHLAPEHFRSVAKPTFGPSEIFPQNVSEYIEHKKGMMAMRESELLQSAARLKEQIKAWESIPPGQRMIKPAFGGKVFNDGLSPSLMQKTIWSEGGSTADWPSMEELQWYGDNRQSRLARTKCGRFLPPPRVPMGPEVPFLDRPIIKPNTFDETGPIFSTGPRPDYAERHNMIMNNDAAFEKKGKELLGADLMEEVGEWKEPFVPDWQQALAKGDGNRVNKPNERAHNQAQGETKQDAMKLRQNTVQGMHQPMQTNMDLGGQQAMYQGGYPGMYHGAYAGTGQNMAQGVQPEMNLGPTPAMTWGVEPGLALSSAPAMAQGGYPNANAYAYAMTQGTQVGDCPNGNQNMYNVVRPVMDPNMYTGLYAGTAQSMHMGAYPDTSHNPHPSMAQGLHQHGAFNPNFASEQHQAMGQQPGTGVTWPQGGQWH